MVDSHHFPIQRAIGGRLFELDSTAESSAAASSRKAQLDSLNRQKGFDKGVRLVRCPDTGAYAVYVQARWYPKPKGA